MRFQDWESDLHASCDQCVAQRTQILSMPDVDCLQATLRLSFSLNRLETGLNAMRSLPELRLSKFGDANLLSNNL